MNERMIRKGIKNIYCKFLMPRNQYKYYKKANTAYLKRNYKETLEILDEAIKVFPDNYQFHVLIVNTATKSKKWKKAAEHWAWIFSLRKRKPKEIAYVAYSNALYKSKDYKEAKTVILEGLTEYPKSKKLKLQLANIYYVTKQYEEVINVLTELDRRHFKYHQYHILLQSYLMSGDKQSARELIDNANLSELDILKLETEYYESFKCWHEVILCIEKKIELLEHRVSEDLLIYLTQLYLITGQKDKADETLKQNQIKDISKYKKEELFYNGETKIEFYKKHKKADTLVVTFDSLNMTWKSSKPFGYQLLSRQDVDILAIRRERPNTQHQDLSREEFYDIVKDLASCYEHKVAYGYSLGGYTSLYYGSIIECRILSLAPRISLHPLFGRKGHMSELDFKHNLYLPNNNNLAPIVVYDPKQKLDNRFVEENVLPAYPHAHLIKINYGGHGIAPHLLRIGQLKEFVLNVVNENKVPKYNRKLKGNSNIYLRVLGQACLNKNKLYWANNLVDRSLELLATDKYANRLKINVLIKMGEFDSAIQFAYQAKENVPKDIKVREQLIELLIQNDLKEQAKEELHLAISKFGEVHTLQKFKDSNKLKK